MKKLYEIECQRNNISPCQFFTYIHGLFNKKAGYDLDDWVTYDDWSGKTDHEKWDIYNRHEDWDEPQLEILRAKPFDWQFFLGGTYNLIIEFEFDDEKRGHGYMYAVEYDTEGM